MKKKEGEQKDASLRIDGCLDRRCGSAWMACSPTSPTSWLG
jgi:hypothetical protein